MTPFRTGLAAVWWLVCLGAIPACSRDLALSKPAVAGANVLPLASAPTSRTFEATAYSIEGKTAAGGRAREGIVAADPKVLPLGTRIRVRDAEGYDGVYVVSDTGRTIDGQEIDIYLANDSEAKRFGRKQVQVEIIDRPDRKRGDRAASP